MGFEKEESKLRKILRDLSDARRDINSKYDESTVEGMWNNTYLNGQITLAKCYIRKVLKHLEKITQYNEGGDEDEKDEQNGRDSGGNR